MARFILLLFLFVLSSTVAFTQSSASLQGIVKDKDKGEPLFPATVALYKNGVLIRGTETDFDGRYSFNPIDPGTYTLKVTYVGYTPQEITDIKVLAGRATFQNIEIQEEGITGKEVVVIAYKVPLFEADKTTTGAVVTSEQIDKLPTKDILGIASTTAGVSSNDDGGDLSFRGSRTDANDIYIDGVRVSGGFIPQSEIEQLEIVTGGVSATVGDVTGGVISITSKSFSSTFSGRAEVETSRYLDDYGYDLASLALAGPILKNDKGEAVIGYRFSGQYRSLKDRDPAAFGVYKLTDEAYAELSENPLTLISTGGILSPVPAAQFLTADDVELVKARPTSSELRYDATGKIDFRLTNTIDIAIGGSFNYRETNPVTRSVFNYNSNRTDVNLDARGYFRFRQRFGSSNQDEADQNKSTTAIRNASYTLQLGYEYREREREDKLHQDNLFNYGYIGNFTHSEVPQFGITVDTTGNITRQHIGNFINLESYAPSDINANLVNYNKFVEDFDAITDFPYFNGNYPEALMEIYGLHSNVNNIRDQRDFNENEQYQFNANGSFELVPGGNDKGKHSIKFGIVYEQRVERGYAIGPRELWTVGRQLLNSHFNGLDTASVIGQAEVNGEMVDLYANLVQDDVWAAIDPENRTDEQDFFDKSIRTLLGAGRTEYIDIDALTPDQLKLEYFAPDELITNNMMNYYGYDYLGNKVSSSVSFNDFFTERDPNTGVFLRQAAANRPIYTGAYIEDKFFLDDIIFRIGLRVDRYDANTKVLKDPYVLYDTYSASELNNLTGVNIPSTIGGDYVVYTNDGTSNGAITAFRNGDDWFDASGTLVNSPFALFGGDRALPALVNPDDDIRSANFDPNSGFEDATPSVVWMPRLSFSFPISDAATFFAHYDVLAQRPRSNTISTPLDYFNFQDNVQTPDFRFNNSALKPERTIDYEVGFKQRLSQNSALTIAAYYKEFRDMIQTRTYAFAYPLNYDTYGNEDFGTTKGINLFYDMRRVNNISLGATYTLQVAEGTGSDANTRGSNINQGNLRAIFPFDFDERHRFTATLDYRYGEGPRYNGPQINGRNILERFGVNLTFITASGRPYTAAILPAIPSASDGLGGIGTRGALNGARYPWNTVLNLRIDKDFLLAKPNKESGNRATYVNVYLRIQNLLDTRNVLDVYTFSGSPDDNGYLTHPIGQSLLSDQIDEAAYLLSYQWALLNPDFYSLPRRIFVGALVTF